MCISMRSGRRKTEEARNGFEQSLDATVEGEEAAGPGTTIVDPEPNPEEEVVRGVSLAGSAPPSKAYLTRCAAAASCATSRGSNTRRSRTS